MKLAGYLRVSTDEQKLDSQRDAIEGYARLHKHEILRYYEDVAVSGATRARPGLDALLEDASRRQFQGVIVYKVDRLARSTKHLIELAEYFAGLRLEFVSATQPIDTTTPMGRAFYQMMGVMAELERGLIAERVAAGMASAKKRGIRLGRPPERTVDRVALAALLKSGASGREMARRLGIPRRSLSRYVAALADPGAQSSENSAGGPPQ